MAILWARKWARRAASGRREWARAFMQFKCLAPAYGGGGPREAVSRRAPARARCVVGARAKTPFEATARHHASLYYIHKRAGKRGAEAIDPTRQWRSLLPDGDFAGAKLLLRAQPTWLLDSCPPLSGWRRCCCRCVASSVRNFER
eukprot:scaffold4720_cov382-Prasinococcus_capsulatus_cf.AAC.1